MFTKTEIRALKLFTSRILDSFTIREVSRLIKKDIKIVHTAIKSLIKENFFIGEKKGLRLNYKNNTADLAYIESIRKEAFLRKHTLIKIHINNFLARCKNKFFILLVFGSYASGKETRKSDIDLLLITPAEGIELERSLKAVLSSMEEFHITSITGDNFIEMLKKREELNVVNETFNNHIILYGAEQYYALLGERDVR